VSGCERSCSSSQPRAKERRPQRVARDADLLLLGQLGEAVELVGDVEVAAGLVEQLVDHGGEVGGGEQGHEVGGRLVEAVVVASLVDRVRQTDQRVDDEMAELVGHDIEVEAERAHRAVRTHVGADLEEAVAGTGVVEAAEERDLEPLLVALEVPGQRALEVALPDVQDEAGRAVDVGELELGRGRGQVVQVAVRRGDGGRKDRAVPRRQVEERRRAGGRDEAVGAGLADRVDDVHARVGRTRAEAAGRGGDEDGLGHAVARQERGLREQAHPGPVGLSRQPAAVAHALVVRRGVPLLIR
jgi:hypothetical protein